MTIKPNERYPGQTDTSDAVGWPYGRAQNESTPGARNGTPFESLWLGDLWGFQQALLEAAELTPSDDLDKAGNSGQDSQGVQAIRALNFKLGMALPTAAAPGSHFTFVDGWQQTTFGATAGSTPPLMLPLGPFPYSFSARRTYLKKVSVRVKPVSHAAMPAEKPGFRVYRTTAAGLLSVNGQVYVDPSPDISAYNIEHSIDGVLSSSLELTSSLSLYVGIFGEYNTNATTGLMVLGVSCELSDRP